MNEEYIRKAILAQVQNEMRLVIDDEISKAVGNIAKTIRSKADTMALDLLSEYDIRNSGMNVIITVKKS